MDQTTMIYIHVSLKKNHVMNGKVHAIRNLCFNNSIKTKCSTFKLYQKVSIPHVAPGPVCNGLNYNNVLYKCCTKELVTILVEHPLSTGLA